MTDKNNPPARMIRETGGSVHIAPSTDATSRRAYCRGINAAATVTVPRLKARRHPFAHRQPNAWRSSIRRPDATKAKERGYKVIEVTNSCAQSSHDQAWRMRPLRLNSDTSAISRTMPHAGILVGQNSASKLLGRGRRLECSSSTSPRRSLTAPRFRYCVMLRRVCGAAATPL